jgi:hypothetical protein
LARGPAGHGEVMGLILRLPSLLLEALLDRGARWLIALVGLLRDRPLPREPEAPAPEPPVAAPIVHPVAPVDRVAGPGPGPGLRRQPIGVDGHVDREAEIVDSSGPARDVGASIVVDPPWEAYDALPAGAIVARLRGADAATKAVVRLYEQSHRARATVLRATG